MMGRNKRQQAKISEVENMGKMEIIVLYRNNDWCEPQVNIKS